MRSNDEAKMVLNRKQETQAFKAKGSKGPRRCYLFQMSKNRALSKGL